MSRFLWCRKVEAVIVLTKGAKELDEDMCYGMKPADSSAEMDETEPRGGMAGGDRPDAQLIFFFFLAGDRRKSSNWV